MATEDGRMEFSTADEIDRLPGRVGLLETAVAALPTTYQTLTAAAKQDAALVQLIDTGAKNVANWNASTETITDVTFTVNADQTVTTTASGAVAARRQKALNLTIPASLPAGAYVLSGCPAGGVSGTVTYYCLYIWDLTASTRVSQNDTGNGVEFEWTPDPTHNYNISIDIRSGANPDGLVFKPMICAKAAYDISPKFVQYAPSNRELYDMINGTRSLSMSAAPQERTEEEER